MKRSSVSRGGTGAPISASVFLTVYKMLFSELLSVPSRSNTMFLYFITFAVFPAFFVSAAPQMRFYRAAVGFYFISGENP